jgi:hypothetical protein
MAGGIDMRENLPGEPGDEVRNLRTEDGYESLLRSMDAITKANGKSVMARFYERERQRLLKEHKSQGKK